MTRSLIPALLVALGAVSTSAGCHKTEASQPAKGPQPPAGEVWVTPKQVADAKIVVATVDEQNVDDTILTAGRIAFDDLRVAHIYSPVTGKVARIDAQPGQRVKKGDPLLLIESPDIGIASSDVAKAQADVIAAEHDFNRQKELYEVHAAAKKDLEQSEDNYRKAKAELERAKAKAYLFRAGGGDSVTQGFTLRSAIDGEVLARAINPGAEVQGQYGGGTAVELFTIGELDRVWAFADVFEIDLPRVKVGSPVVVKVVSYPGKEFPGTVEWVAGVLDPATRSARIRCSFDNHERLLKPEMYATAEIHVEARKAIAIPRSSILRLGDQTVVFLETGEAPEGRVRFERVPVQVDEGEGSAWVPVLNGVQRGKKIVTSGAILLSSMT